ncbi:DUF1656 domain-containing protein [Novosphingobium sp. 1949]|uniref:DUF1656 domain-containing protein n=1 Tax=Novosphingobium organovorum TaxID=2930092 RepID=A0ABT0BE54_9SPHN|nr:DUF1656 domain-containing protein [Novosphingobium organovorum]MCJ2183263.1 DUF1656 domain-containing protein [Novosphingobium organovorum]
MIPDYRIADIFVAAAPIDGLIALLVALVLHRLLSFFNVYRWVWHPVLFDTAMFIVVWAALIRFVPSPIIGMTP